MALISKRELLEITGISYGQLYRWKREGLIPEEWFIKRAAYTGQETFLPRDQAISRISQILSLKDTCSLSEIRDMLLGKHAELTHEVLEGIRELSPDVARVLPELCKDSLRPTHVYFAAAICSLAEHEAVNLLFECDDIIRALKSEAFTVTVAYTDKAHAILTSGRSRPAISSTLKLKGSVYLADVAEKLRAEYPEVFCKHV